MKILVIILLILTLFLPNDFKFNLTLLYTIMWTIATIYNYIKVFKLRDKKICSNSYLTNAPNNNLAYYIRYLYKGRIDEKVFVSTIIELILKKEITIERENKVNYYLVDTNNNLNLTKSEEFVKKIIFNNIKKSERVSLEDIKLSFRKSSGFMYNVYNEWIHIFSYESALLKYFKSTKSLKDSMIFYFVLSFIIAIYNLLFTNAFIFLFIFITTSILIYLVNDFINREDDAKVELKKWLEYKNYIEKNDNELYKLDISSLERCLVYSYVLDANYSNILSKVDNDKINGSLLLLLMKSGIFDIINNDIIRSIKIAKFNVIVLLSKNKGRL